MKHYIIYISAILLGFMSLSSCDPTSPETSSDDFLTSENPMTSWVNGINKEMALAVGMYAELLDVATDNYRNVYSRSNREFDKPNILYTDYDVENLQRSVGKLREMANYALNTIAVNDKPTDEQLKDIYTALAYSYILAGENFIALPLTENGAPAEWQQHLHKAADVLNEANEKVASADFKPVYHTLLARIYYRLGDKAEAKKNAEKALEYDKTFCAMVQFDEENGVVSTIKDRSFSTNWWEPLPRLDFLDPKYQEQAASQRIAFAKAEEDYLILAECSVTDAAQLADFKARLLPELFALIQSRGTVTITDSLEMREAKATDGSMVKLNTSDWKVKSSAAGNAVSGLVLHRVKGTISIPSVSGTSVKEQELGNATGDDFLELIYLMRQEVFFAEGRRFADLGMRMPLCEVEAAKIRRTYPDIEVSRYTTAVIPAYIPTEEYGMDSYEVDAENKVITIKYDMNREIVRNKALDCIVPFE